MAAKTLLPIALLMSLALAACGQAPATSAQARPGAVRAAGLTADPAGILAPKLPTPAFAPAEADVLYDGDTFPALEAIVKRATKSVRIDYYIFGGPTAERMADTLVAKRQQGVDVRVLLDAKLGTVPEMTKAGTAVLRRLREGGIPVAFHSRKPIPARTGGETIDHNKYVVVDEAEALVGSMNLARKFYQYHDLMIHVRGDAAGQLAAQHARDWYQATHPEAPVPRDFVALPAEDPQPLAADGPGLVRVVGTGLGRKTGVAALLPLLRTARTSIHVQMHEIGPGPVLDALVAARDRGVDVRLILDPGVVDPFVPVIHKAPRGIVNAVALDALLKAKMDVRHFKVDAALTTAHMKSAVIDGRILFAGSTNWTTGGFEAVAETNLEIRGGRAPAQAEAMFARDWATRSVPAEPPSALALQLCKLYQRLGS
jgi:phosphatidylserine/phosphatidylglycerophosphate/cardiolipin synthase-like enzyme